MENLLQLRENYETVAHLFSQVKESFGSITIILSPKMSSTKKIAKAYKNEDLIFHFSTEICRSCVG
jgi:hypothetical protein